MAKGNKEKASTAQTTPTKVESKDSKEEQLSNLSNIIKEDASCLDRFLDMIPPKFYFPINQDENESNPYLKFTHKRGRDKQQVKENSKKAKKLKLDPQQNKTVTELQKETKEAKKKETEKESDSDSDEDEEGEDDDEEGGAENGESTTTSQSTTPIKEGFLQTLILSTKHNEKNADELRKQLAERIATLKRKRESTKDPSRKKQKKKKVKKESDKDKEKPFASKLKDTKPPPPPKPEPSEEVVEGPLQFGTFDFSSGKPTPTYLLDKQRKKKKDEKSVLKKLELEKALLDEIKDTEEGKELIKQKSYKTMLQKAQGVKVKDDPKLLKKSIKKKEKKKAKSAAAWKERTKNQKKEQKSKMKQRQQNIQEHLEKKKEQKLRKKKGLKRPGFEGKKKEFINKDSKKPAK